MSLRACEKVINSNGESKNSHPALQRRTYPVAEYIVIGFVS